MKTKEFNKTFFAIILILFVFFSIGSIGYTIYYHTQEKPLTSSTGYFNVLNYAVFDNVVENM